MASQGWISIHRKIEDDWLWSDKPFSKGQAWIDLLLMVNHEDKGVLFNGELIEVKRGQRITSIKQLCKRWGWSNTKVVNFLKLLEQDKKIILEITSRKKSVVTIVNYSKYQSVNVRENVTETSEKRQKNVTETSQKHINNNDNNENNENNEERDIFNILKAKIKKEFSLSSVKKLIKRFGLEDVKMLAEKIDESAWLKRTINLNKISNKFFELILNDEYKDYEKEEGGKSEYEWYKPIEL